MRQICLKMGSVGLGNMRRCFIMGIFVSLSFRLLETWADDTSPLPTAESLAQKARAGDWKSLAKADWPSEPFAQLLIQRARYELQNWDQVLAAPPIEDPLFSDYDLYLRVLAAFARSDHEKTLELQPGDSLPTRLQEDVTYAKAQSLAALKKWIEAKAAFRNFLSRFPRSSRKTEAQLELASIEWELENHYEALQLYREVYENDISSRADTALHELQQRGALESVSLDTHLSRADRLRRAALFEKGVRELTQLRRRLEAPEQRRIDLALANFEFARRHYQRSEALARSALSNEELDESLRLDWHQLLAFSLVRQGKYDLARVEYAQILEKRLSPRDRQVILFRLGLMAVDDQNFEAARENFQKLREGFPNGIYQESSHWFEAWSIFQKNRLKSAQEDVGVNRAEINHATRLLDRLPRLPEGERLSAQALYWKSELENLANEKTKAERTRQKLLSDWQASFHSLLVRPEKMRFSVYQPHFVNPKLIEPEPQKYRVADPAFQQPGWKRLEAFVSAQLSSWAQHELQVFLTQTGSKNQGLRNAVARRLQSLGDWSDLIRYAQNNFPFNLKGLQPEDPIARLFYPQAYAEDILAAAAEFEVSPFLIWGVMREESRFQSDVISPAGAVGLMQLMPNLGSQIARSLREGRVERLGLTDPKKNIRYGTYHLRELFQQVDRLQVPPEFRTALVVASYNAGIGPVRRWIRELNTDRLDLFVESIPFTETRNYVKRVLQSAYIYYLLYGERVKEIANSSQGGEL
ncbi:MAG: hypothetical protein EA369_06495 [Bradymonadales bacterium]|nr:MAG: hypothetical protein EA369_06495 [Bradymonadales bacterium]